MEKLEKSKVAFIDSVGEAVFGLSRTEALEKGICIECREPQCIVEMDPWDAKEYKQSALCPGCWETIMSS